MFKSANNLAFSSSVVPRAAADDLRNAVPVAGRRFGARAVSPEQSDLGLIFCARRTDSRAEFLNLLVVRSVLLAIERGRSRADETVSCCSSQTARRIPIAATNKEETPEASESTRQDHCRQVAGLWRWNHHSPARRGFGWRRIRPTRCLCLLWAIGNCSENRGMKRIEGGCVAGKQADERLVRCGAGSGYTRRTGRHCAWHQVGFMGASDAVHSIVDCDVKNRETARGNRWRCPVGANCVQCCVVPVGYDVAIGSQANTSKAR